MELKCRFGNCVARVANSSRCVTTRVANVLNCIATRVANSSICIATRVTNSSNCLARSCQFVILYHHKSYQFIDLSCHANSSNCLARRVANSSNSLTTRVTKHRVYRHKSCHFNIFLTRVSYYFFGDFFLSTLHFARIMSRESTFEEKPICVMRLRNSIRKIWKRKRKKEGKGILFISIQIVFWNHSASQFFFLLNFEIIKFKNK